MENNLAEKSNELKELLESFKNDIEGAIEIVKIDPTLQFVFNDFESWEGLEEKTEEIKNIISLTIGVDLNLMEENEIEGENEKILVQVFQGDDEGVFLVKYKYEDNSIVLAIRGEGYEE